MKAYVNWFESDAKKARAATGDQTIRDGAVTVQFNPSPEHWLMSETEAREWCANLNRSGVSFDAFPDHVCKFQIEEVRPGEWAIVCNEHPHPVSGSPSELFS
jgi:hypothetical protein